MFDKESKINFGENMCDVVGFPESYHLTLAKFI
jgi:hypothetical protein